MKLPVTKIHGCRNDYLFIDRRDGALPHAEEIARRVSDRRGGVGADGIILVRSSECADFRMEMYNADGSRGEMCGNGIRGLAKFVHDHGLMAGERDRLTIETDAGIRELDLHKSAGKVANVTVNMGKPEFEARHIPVAAEGQVIDHPIEVAGRIWQITCVSMGNPHAVTFDADPEQLDLERLGPNFASHAFFPQGINTEFIRVESPQHLIMRVWERGSGETAACGTGACAAVAAGAVTGRCGRRVTVSLPGGDLEIDYPEQGDVFMTGPAVEVFSGTVEVNVGS